MEAQRKSERKLEGKGEPGEASAEIDAGGRRKEIADETCMKLSEWKPKGGNHRFMMVDFKNHAVSTEKSGLFCFYNAPGATRWVALFCSVKLYTDRRDVLRSFGVAYGSSEYIALLLYGNILIRYLDLTLREEYDRIPK